MEILKGLFKEFGWFIWGLIGIGIVWFAMGGTENPQAHEGPYLKPPAPLSTGEAYGGQYLITDKHKATLDLPEGPAIVVRNIEGSLDDFLSLSDEAERIHANSLLATSLYLDGLAGAQSSDPQKEYLRILSNEKSPKAVDLSTLSLHGGAYGVQARLPQAANLPVLATAYQRSDVMLPPGGRALVTTGRSPIGTSFRVNICSGYLEQFQDFTPNLRQECPNPLDELKASGPYAESACRDFVEKLPRCKAYGGTLPSDISPSCKAFVTEKLTYNSCVASHRDDKGFVKDEWRLFLEQGQELWKNRQEIIKLIDSSGSTVDAITF